MARRPSALGSVVAIVAMVVLSWLAVRSMTAKQRAAYDRSHDAGDAAGH